LCFSSSCSESTDGHFGIQTISNPADADIE
jgi:hypothetical protein